MKLFDIPVMLPVSVGAVLGPLRLQFQGATLVTSSHSLREREPLSGFVWNVMTSALWLLKLIQKSRRANSEGHRRRYKSNKTKMENYVMSRTSLSSQQEVKRAIQETLGHNLHSFCNDYLLATRS